MDFVADFHRGLVHIVVLGVYSDHESEMSRIPYIFLPTMFIEVTRIFDQ
jgi:hypothetical protein